LKLVCNKGFLMDDTRDVALDTIDYLPETLIDAVVYGSEDERIGRVSHVQGKGIGTHVVIDVGGFLGFGVRRVMVDNPSLTFYRNSDGDVHATTAWTKDQFMALPEHLD